MSVNADRRLERVNIRIMAATEQEAAPTWTASSFATLYAKSQSVLG